MGPNMPVLSVKGQGAENNPLKRAAPHWYEEPWVALIITDSLELGTFGKCYAS